MRLSLNRNLAGLLMAFPLATATLSLRPLPAIAQEIAQDNPNNTLSDNWTDFPVVAAQFQEGCLGTETLTPEQTQAKENFCQCIWQEYQIRYTPTTFAKINTLVSQLGSDGLTLVNIMLEPELNSCARITDYVRPL